MRQIELNADGVLGADAGEGHVGQCFGVHEFRVEPIDPLDRFADIFDFETEVIEPLAAAGALGEQRHADDAVADVAAFGVGFAAFVHQPGGDLLHAKYSSVKSCHGVVTFRVGGEVANSGEHRRAPWFADGFVSI